MSVKKKFQKKAIKKAMSETPLRPLDNSATDCQLMTR